MSRNDDAKARQLLQYVKSGEADLFFQSQPSLNDLLGAKSGKTHLQVISAVVKQRSEWLSRIYQDVVLPHFFNEENGMHTGEAATVTQVYDVIFWAAACNCVAELYMLLAPLSEPRLLTRRESIIAAWNAAEYFGHGSVLEVLQDICGDVLGIALA